MLDRLGSGRLRRLLDPRSGRLFIVPMDHGISLGAVPGLYDVADTVDHMTATGVNAIVVHKGLVRTLEAGLLKAPDLGLIVHLCASTALAPDPNQKCLVCTVQEALSWGADAVSVHVNIGAETEAQMLHDFADVQEHCRDLNLPLLAMIYARGPGVDDPFSERLNIHCARVAYEIGADLVKVAYTGSVESFRRVVDSVPIPVLIAGGPRMETDQEVAEMVRHAIEAGAAGISIGRNVFGAHDVRGTCQSLAKIVHG